jgi:hypothetical protein
MLFSFASIAVSLWLGLVAVACLHRLWRATANHGNGYSNRDYSRAAGGENRQDYHRGDRRSGGLISIACRWVISVSQVVINIFRAALSRTTGWIPKMFRRSEPPHRPIAQPSSISLGIPNALSVASEVPAKGDTPKTLTLDRSAGAAKRKRAPHVSSQTSEARCESSQPKQSKTNRRVTRAGTPTPLELPEGHSRKKPQKLKVLTNTVKKTARAKPKVSAAAKVPLIPKTSI